MTSSEIRQSFLDFFKEKQHTIVPSSSLLPDSPNLLFTNAGMNQFVPIFLGQTPCSYKPARAADTQKCIRAGGKHNDLEDVGFDTYHHTFFEMLGNWSFGDYFKKDAIEWAWELVVGRWNFPASRVYATVYSPGTGDPAGFDREAHEHWSEIFIQAKLDPAYHVVHGNKKDNFWMMGETGPCGPCSELHINLTPGPRDLDIPAQIQGRNLVNQGDARCIEIWNLVFIQFNANPDGTFVDLPAKHVDTGMGFERVTSMIQGTNGLTDFTQAGKISNYETDVFRPLFDELEKITGKKYGSTLPTSAQNLSEQEKIDVAFRVIADHVRTLSFSRADDIEPGNNDRNYVLRRIVRRAVKYGRNVGLNEPFLGKLVDVLGKTMGHIFPEVVAKSDLIRKTLAQEEQSFSRTLETGLTIFNGIVQAIERIERRAGEVVEQLSRYNVEGPSAIRRLKDTFMKEGPTWCPPDADYGIGMDHKRLALYVDDIIAESEFPIDKAEAVDRLLKQIKGQISGTSAFLLYDTYGFPLDLTDLMARELGMHIDVVLFSRLMEQQRQRSQAAQKKNVITVKNDDRETNDDAKYGDSFEITTQLVFSAGERRETSILNEVVPRETPFYVAMGGQVGDTGIIKLGNQSVEVVDTEKVKDAIHHFLKPGLQTKDILPVVTLIRDQPRRARIEAHHSGTHLLNWALRKVLGNTITQKGSYVGPDRLRFDFSHGAALTSAELAEVEKLINEKIEEDVKVDWQERPYADVKGDPSILQFFGDKYGDVVRVVSIGDFSRELCGGTHVRESGKIGYFKILSEGAIAAGVRRIEAASGTALIEHVHDNLLKQEELHAALRERKADLSGLQAFFGDKTPRAFWTHWAERENFLRASAAEVARHEKDSAKHLEASLQKRAAADAPELIASATIGGVPFLIREIKDAPVAYLPILADALKHQWQGVAVLAAVDQGKVALLAAVAPAFSKKIQAGKIIQAIAPLVGGKGGGRPELAQGGGTNPEGVAAALAKAEELVRAS